MMHVKFFALHHATPPQKVLSRLFQFNTIKYQGSSTTQASKALHRPSSNGCTVSFISQPRNALMTFEVKWDAYTNKDLLEVFLIIAMCSTQIKITKLMHRACMPIYGLSR